MLLSERKIAFIFRQNHLSKGFLGKLADALEVSLDYYWVSLIKWS